MTGRDAAQGGRHRVVPPSSPTPLAVYRLLSWSDAMHEGDGIWQQLVWLWDLLVGIVRFFFGLLAWLAR